MADKWTGIFNVVVLIRLDVDICRIDNESGARTGHGSLEHAPGMLRAGLQGRHIVFEDEWLRIREPFARYLDDLGMTRWRHPSRVEVLPALPRNPAGKVRKELLRRWLRGETTLPD
jgi:acyl-CoA synthetase (AMP-forming)/AMP-acid ligase II